jgi:YHS domain-containing protein
VKDPEQALQSLGLGFLAPGGRDSARIDSTTRVWVGHDLFYFADRAARDRFLSDPLAQCRALTDPVTQRRFHPSRKSPQLSYRGRQYFFQTDSTRAVFRGMPDWYAQRGPMDEATPMAPKPPAPAPH